MAQQDLQTFRLVAFVRADVGEAFVQIAHSHTRTTSQELRRLIEEYVEKHGSESSHES